MCQQYVVIEQIDPPREYRLFLSTFYSIIDFIFPYSDFKKDRDQPYVFNPQQTIHNVIRFFNNLEPDLDDCSNIVGSWWCFWRDVAIFMISSAYAFIVNYLFLGLIFALFDANFRREVGRVLNMAAPIHAMMIIGHGVIHLPSCLLLANVLGVVFVIFILPNDMLFSSYVLIPVVSSFVGLIYLYGVPLR